MTKFKVKDTFYITTKQYFVVAGEVLSGEVERGRKLTYKFRSGRVVEFPIQEVNFLDRFRPSGDSSYVALCFKCTRTEFEGIFKKLPWRGRVFDSEHFTHPLDGLSSKEVMQNVLKQEALPISELELSSLLLWRHIFRK